MCWIHNRYDWFRWPHGFILMLKVISNVVCTSSVYNIVSGYKLESGQIAEITPAGLIPSNGARTDGIAGVSTLNGVDYALLWTQIHGMFATDKFAGGFSDYIVGDILYCDDYGRFTTKNLNKNQAVGIVNKPPTASAPLLELDWCPSAQTLWATTTINTASSNVASWSPALIGPFTKNSIIIHQPEPIKDLESKSKVKNICDCGGAKANTTHSDWCSTNNK